MIRIATAAIFAGVVGAFTITADGVADADPSLTPNEQQFVEDLAGVGIVPTEGDRVMVNSGYRVCSVLSNGKSKDFVANTIAGSIAGSHLNQAQVEVDSAIRNLCPGNALAPQHTPIYQPGAPDHPAAPGAQDDPAQHPILNNPPPLMGPKTSPYGPGNYGPGDVGR